MRCDKMMRMPKGLLDDLRGLKIAKRESYAEVIERMIKKNRLKGGLKI